MESQNHFLSESHSHLLVRNPFKDSPYLCSETIFESYLVSHTAPSSCHFHSFGPNLSTEYIVAKSRHTTESYLHLEPLKSAESFHERKTSAHKSPINFGLRILHLDTGLFLSMILWIWMFYNRSVPRCLFYNIVSQHSSYSNRSSMSYTPLYSKLQSSHVE